MLLADRTCLGLQPLPIPCIQGLVFARYLLLWFTLKTSVCSRDIYNKFFTLAPAGQDFFKQSNTYLHIVADKILAMTLPMGPPKGDRREGF